MLLYALLYLTGYADCSLEQIKNFRQLKAKTAGHPEFGHLQGIETTTGPLGQGFSNAVGMAIAERLMNARFQDEIIGHYTYVIVGDGCLMEGITQEAISLAGHLQLSRLIVLFDDNGITIDGETNLSTSEDHQVRFRAVGFETASVDGHDPDAIHQAISKARQSEKPSLICCKTHIGFGSPNRQDSSKAHGSPLGADEVALVREKLGWAAEAFQVPEEILQKWRQIGERSQKNYAESMAKIETLSEADKKLWGHIFAHNLAIDSVIAKIKNEWQAQVPTLATRKSSEFVLNYLTDELPCLIGGSADLTGSNNTKGKAQKIITADDFSGSYLNYGIREHAMGGVMNGIALYGGFVPYGGTFMVFSDYVRPAIRLSALMRQQVIYVFTHDSIGLGEDGPTHQPVEHLAALRAIPDLLVLRPADAIEVAECWQLALHYRGASAIILTRQNLAPLPRKNSSENLCRDGAYIVQEFENYQISLLATGSEVGLALQTAELLMTQENIPTRVVSVPSMELLNLLEPAKRDDILGVQPRIAVEAGIAQGWARYGVDEENMLAMNSFGTSAPGEEAFVHFGFTPKNFAQKAKELLQKNK